MKDQAIQNALKATPGQSYSDGNIVVGTALNHVVVSFNETTYNKNSILVLQQRDAQTLFALFSAGKAQGWLE